MVSEILNFWKLFFGLCTTARSKFDRSQIRDPRKSQTSLLERRSKDRSRVCRVPNEADSRESRLVLHSHLDPRKRRGPSRRENETRDLAVGGKGWWNEGFLAGQRLSARLWAPTPPPRSRLKAPSCYIGTVLSPSEGACLSDVQVRTGG